jgi:formylglycine-generating enzyme required for sulfatase activity
LVTLLSSSLSASERYFAEDARVRLGDLRFHAADAWYLPDEPLLGFVEIPAGPFLMGSNPERDRNATEDEQPQHEVTLPCYYIARYPVTVAQFQEFVKESRHRLDDEDSLHGRPNHPVVNVTWYDALAYCKWLTERLREWGKTPEPLATLLRQEGWRVTVPSEAEWEKVARGPSTGSGEGHIYPWGDEFDPDKANTNETGINGTSAVGCFPQGASPYGVLDLSGNVWEWTRSLWGRDLGKPDFSYPYSPQDGRENLDASNDVLRVLRGGAYWYPLRYARCAFRLWYNPDYRNWVRGFRVVVLPKL